MGLPHWRAAAAAAILLTGCGSEAERAQNEFSPKASAPAATATAELPNAADEQEAVAPVSYTLSANGLAPGLTFGMPEAGVVKAATSVFGASTRVERNDECGEGPMNFVHFGDLQLGFQQVKFAGWSLGGTKPALHTAGGLTVGAPRSALGAAAGDEGSSIGPEFEIGGVGGVLDDQDHVLSRWAGYPCQFR
jgi:hypothetical protein